MYELSYVLTYLFNGRHTSKWGEISVYPPLLVYVVISPAVVVQLFPADSSAQYVADRLASERVELGVSLDTFIRRVFHDLSVSGCDDLHWTS